MTADSGDKIVQLDPLKVLADPGENAARFGAAESDASQQEMMDSILTQGGVMQPVEVIALNGETKGKFTHRLIYGYRRHGAVARLNKEQSAGLTLPAIVREVAPEDIIKRQIAENNDRKTMSPMDKAVAIKRLLDSGVQKPEIRRIFASIGGKKNNEVQPMSNALLNIYLNFLDLPKTVQEKIHTGAVGVSAAYMLGKVAPDKRAAVLERAEKERAAELETEAKDEERFLAAEKKVEEAKTKQVEAAATVETAKADVEKAIALVTEKAELFNAEKKRILTMEGPAQPADVEAMKAKEADKKAAEKLAKDTKNALAKALKVSGEAEEKAQEKAAQLEAARKLKKNKAGKSKGAGVTRDDIKKGAKAEGTTGAGHVPITLSEFRQALKDLQKDGVPARVSAIGAAFAKLLGGETTPKQLIADLTAILAPKAAAAPKA